MTIPSAVQLTEAERVVFEAADEFIGHGSDLTAIASSVKRNAFEAGVAESAAVEARVRRELPDECYVTRSVDGGCLMMIGGGFANGAKWTYEMCCLPCRVRAALSPADGEMMG